MRPFAATRFGFGRSPCAPGLGEGEPEEVFGRTGRARGGEPDGTQRPTEVNPAHGHLDQAADGDVVVDCQVGQYGRPRACHDCGSDAAAGRQLQERLGRCAES